MSRIATKLVVLSILCLLGGIFLWGVSVGFVYELGFYVVSFIVTGMLVHWFWPDSKGLSLSELRPFLVPIGWGSLIAALFLLAGLWKPFEYIMMPVPAIALLVVFLRRRAKRVGKIFP